MHEPAWLGNMLIYLAAALLCVPLAVRLGLGAILGYLAAGVAIGPAGLGLISDVETILHFAEFGVVLMLFMIGLELEPHRLWAMRQDVFGGGGAQLLACGGLLAGAGLALGLPVGTALLLGLTLALSSTAITVRTLNERNLLPTPVGQLTFGILLFQDIAAIPLIALPSLLGQSGGTEGSQVSMGLGLAVIAGILAAGQYVASPALRLIARTGIRELFTAVALLIVVVIAVLMQRAGLSMALGAFIAGVVLAKSEYRHALEADLEPFKGLLLGLFFIAIGMSIDLTLLAARPVAVLALTGGLLLLKLLALRTLAGPLGVSVAQRWLLAALLAPGGEFAFVILGMTAQAGMIPREQAALLTLSVALSMATTPFLLLAYERGLAPRYASTPPEPETIPMQESPIIIAGFGRFGQIVGRLLFANGITATVLDHDPDQITLLRRFGFQVFYGDSGRLDLLEAAGIAKARLLVVALDDVDASLRLVDAVRAHYPHLPVVARARNVSHLFGLMNRGIEHIERETFESALRAGRRVLRELGFGAHEARLAADTFRRHDLAALDAMYPHYQDEIQLISLAQTARDELTDLFERDREIRERERTGGWG
ncbi:glutathione-regulated potassium-efflux system protein KefC [Candidatus Competibacter phosphatis]|uniref:Glutathione-regulated potassium-efflux system protein KefC n=1 Tax=Candidatus Competibacter phosphatis TaxID=221280 RepID=A0ABX1TN83_9GAMM|nr:glutathione-regulated potassium-efflux system protein KefC [Candidatus Competibacter phosphatis]NMQ20878.1 glutathione-regulated potassium-efflux system protein KefC [Candidatus Competibacter phosphatis]